MEPRVQGSPIILVSVGSVLVGNGWRVESTALKPASKAKERSHQFNPLKKVIPVALFSCALAWALTRGKCGQSETVEQVTE